MHQKQGTFYFKRADERRKSSFDSSWPCGRVESGRLPCHRLPLFKQNLEINRSITQGYVFTEDTKIQATVSYQELTATEQNLSNNLHMRQCWNKPCYSVHCCKVSP